MRSREDKRGKIRLKNCICAYANIENGRSPSTGLLEHPEDAVYYEWVLHDAVEAPFATFCFHYRAWAYLWDLNLVTDGSNSPLHNHGLGEGLGKNRRSDIAHDRSKGEVESSREESDLGNYDEDTKNTQVIEPETTRTRPYSQREALPNKELKSSKPINRQPSHRRKPSLHSTASLREIPRSGDPFITFLLPPVMEEEDPFTSPYIPLGHEMPTTSPTRSYYRHNARSRVHRPLPTVNEVPKLE